MNLWIEGIVAKDGPRFGQFLALRGGTPVENSFATSSEIAQLPDIKNVTKRTFGRVDNWGWAP
jgi:hypothetical protein